MGTPEDAGTVRYSSSAGRWVLLATVLGSGVVGLDATVVNVALPTIGEHFGAGLSSLQWMVNAYTLTLAALILVGGALGDRYGRKRVFVLGVVWFAAASLLCGLAPTAPVLVVARALQGVGGALLTPGSLAILEATFHPDDRSAAIGAWSGLGGVATALGPFAGGYLVDAVSWRWIFLLNLPLAAACVWVALRRVPETSDPKAAPRIDLPGAVLGALGLAGVTYALIEGPGRGFTSPVVLGSAVAGVAAFVAFLLVERASRYPMLPLGIFASHQFSGANLVTLAVYAALGGAIFLLMVNLQSVLGYGALQAGTALLPMTFVMLAVSARAGRLARTVGPRLPMTVGPLTAAAGLALYTRVVAGASYAGAVLPAVVVFALGMSFTVAPLTATVLGAAEDRYAGVASGVNNAVARAAALIAVATLPVLAGIGGDDYTDPAAFSDGFRRAMWIAAVLCAAGGVLAYATIRNDVLKATPEPQPEEASHCSVAAPPLRQAAAH